MKPNYLLDAKSIASKMFWINFYPALLAICILFYFAFNLELKKIDFFNISVMFFFIIGTLMEVGYFFLSKYEIYTEKKMLWIFSIGVNALILITEIVLGIIELDLVIIFFMIYPLAFLILSVKGLRLTNKI